MESRPKSEKREQEYFDLNKRATDFYDDAYFERQYLFGETTFRRYYFSVRPFIGDEESLLDFGCGIGDLLSELPAKVKVGIEINPTSRSYARQRGLDVRASIADLEDTKFSRIVSAHVLEHLVAPAETLFSLRNLLTPDGLLILVLPLDDWRSAPQRHWRPNNIHMHLYAWTPNTIGNLLSICGFEPLKIEIINRAHPPKVGHKLWQLSPAIYSAAAWLFSILLLRREMITVAKISPSVIT